MPLARTLMIQGTGSTVGKSTLVTGLCRIFAAAGMHVAPFKAQNMALNSFVTRDGREMGRAQVVQAEAAGIEPQVEMNPILLKPEGNGRSQVIVMGRPLGSFAAREYWRDRAGLLAVVSDALATLRAEYDLVLIEGAGSPVELNLARNDIVNMRVAQLVDAPVLLVGDIDRGGIFASLLGTLMLLPPEDRARVRGLIVNKFRGDLALWREGEAMLAARAGMPVLGTVPYFTDIAIAEEDSVALAEGSAAAVRAGAAASDNALEIVVVRLPYLANADEFDALAAEPGARLQFVGSVEEFPARPDLIVLPGTKNTIADLGWLWRRGLAVHIRRLAREGCAILGICGGYQMLGERVADPMGAEGEAGAAEPGLGLLPVTSTFPPLEAKVTTRSMMSVAEHARRGLFATLDSTPFAAYQIHVGRTVVTSGSQTDGVPAFAVGETDTDGWLSAGGWCGGGYLHGLFENNGFRHGVLTALRNRRGIGAEHSLTLAPFDRGDEYDKLAAHLQTALDLDLLKRCCGLGNGTKSCS